MNSGQIDQGPRGTGRADSATLDRCDVAMITGGVHDHVRRGAVMGATGKDDVEGPWVFRSNRVPQESRCPMRRQSAARTDEGGQSDPLFESVG